MTIQNHKELEELLESVDSELTILRTQEEQVRETYKKVKQLTAILESEDIKMKDLPQLNPNVLGGDLDMISSINSTLLQEALNFFKKLQFSQPDNYQFRQHLETLEKLAKNEFSPPNVQALIQGGLGIDYGLIFINNWDNKQIAATCDGKSIIKLRKSVGYHKLFYDLEENSLYYTQGNCLFQYPNQMIWDFKTEARGITRYQGELIVCLIKKGKIINSKGEVIATAQDSADVEVFNKKLFHLGDRKGLVSTLKNQLIQTTGKWTDGLTFLGSKLYFGGENQTIYSYGRSYGRTNVETLCQTHFPIWALKGVSTSTGEILYVGGWKKNGILTVPVDAPELQTTILEDLTYQVSSIVAVPIKFIEGLSKKGDKK